MCKYVSNDPRFKGCPPLSLIDMVKIYHEKGFVMKDNGWILMDRQILEEIINIGVTAWKE